MPVTITLHQDRGPASSPGGDVLVVLRYGSLFTRGAQDLDARLDGRLVRACAAVRPNGPTRDIVDLLAPHREGPRRILVLDLGDPAALTGLRASRAGATLARHLETQGETEATLILDPAEGSALTPDDLLARIILGVRLQNYRFPLMAKGTAAPELALTVQAPGIASAALARADAIAEGVCLARDLVNYPASHLHPDNFATFLAPLRDAGIVIEEMDSAALERIGMGAVLAVGNGSARKPRVFALTCKGEGSETRPLALVGKGICFDTGGLSIKTGQQMFTMKGDMAGAAAVIGTMLALARQKAPVHVVGVLGVAENMLSGTSYKPGDIVTTLSGRTVEVYDTDCEGRMVLADILHYAATRFDPLAIVDLATLTYSVMRGLGHVFAGLFATHDTLAQGISAAGEACGERFWRLPLDPAYDEGLRSPVADLRQHARDLEDGDAPYAAAFLRHFTEGRPWVHLDIAGKEMTTEDRLMAREGGVGFGVLTLEEWIHRGGAGAAPV